MSFGDGVKRMCARTGIPVPNTDLETGVAYGISGPDETPDWVWDEAEGIYPIGCPECGSETEDAPDDGVCEVCGAASHPDHWHADSAAGWEIKSPDVDAICDSDGIYWTILRSSRIEMCRECSPCFPCAGDLGSIGDLPTYGWPDDSRDPVMMYRDWPEPIRIRAAAERLRDVTRMALNYIGDRNPRWAPGRAQKLADAIATEDAMRRERKE